MNYNTGIKYNTGIRYNSPSPPIEAEGIIVRGANGRVVAILTPEDGLKDAEINNTLNGECTLTFSLPVDSDKRQYIDVNCTIEADNKEFVVLTPDAKEIVREGKNKWERIIAHESWVLLGKKYTTISNDPENTDPVPFVVEILSGGTPYPGCTAGSAKSALSYLLLGAGWTVGIVDVEGIHDLETEKESILANINKVQQIWGGYLIWDSKNRIVHLRDEEKWQVYTGYQIRYAKNLKGITRTDDYDIVTRLYPFGENELDIRTVNNNILYIENFSYTNRVLEGMWQNQEIDDPQELKDAAIKELARLCRPRHNYQVEHIDLRNIDKQTITSLTMPGLFLKIESGPHTHETFTIGNMVDIIDEELGINTRARIIHHRYNLIHDWLCDVEIGDPLEDLKTVISDTVATSDFVNRALKPNTSISNLLKGFVNTFSTVINSADGRLLWDDGVFEAVEVDVNGDLTGRRVRITPGGIGISNDYGETYVTAMTGDGILANTIICSMLYALSSEDGYTQLVGDGLRVYDAEGRLRAHLGQYLGGLFGLILYNIYGDRVFEADTDGNLKIIGDFITYSGSNKALEMDQWRLKLYDWEGTTRTEPVGVLFTGRKKPELIVPSVYLGHNSGTNMGLGYQSTEDITTYFNYISFDKFGVLGQEEPIEVWQNIYMNASTINFGKGKLFYSSSPAIVLANTSNNFLTLNYEEGNTTYPYVRFDRNNVSGQEEQIKFFQNVYMVSMLRFSETYLVGNIEKGINIRNINGTALAGFTFNASSGWDISFHRSAYFGSKVYVYGNFDVYGTKNAIIETEHYGERRVSAYETAEYYFGDIGSGTINQDGECIIYVDNIFSECANTEIEYHVFLQKCGQGDLWVSEKHENYFVIEGTPGLSFSWELKAKRRGYEFHRLEQPGIDMVVDTANFDDIICDNKVVIDVLEKELTFQLDDYLLS